MIWDWLYVLLVGMADSFVASLPVYQPIGLCFGCSAISDLVVLISIFFGSFIDMNIVLICIATALLVRFSRLGLDLLNAVIDLIPFVRKWM